MWYITFHQATRFAKSIPGCQFGNGHPILAVFYGVELGSFGTWDSTTHIPNIIIFRVMHDIYLCAVEHLEKFCFQTWFIKFIEHKIIHMNCVQHFMAKYRKFQGQKSNNNSVYIASSKIACTCWERPLWKNFYHYGNLGKLYWSIIH